MGLPNSFKKMLKAPFTWEPWTGIDQWGNIIYGAATQQYAFISDGVITPSSGEVGQMEDVLPAIDNRVMYVDALGIRYQDRITFDGIKHYVTNVTNYKNQKGQELFQVVSIENEVKG